MGQIPELHSNHVPVGAHFLKINWTCCNVLVVLGITFSQNSNSNE